MKSAFCSHVILEELIHLSEPQLSCQSGDANSLPQGYCERQVCSVMRGRCVDGNAGQLCLPVQFLGEGWH